MLKHPLSDVRSPRPVACGKGDIHKRRVFGDGESGEPEKVELLKLLKIETADRDIF
jgi:hypothetical protein